MNPNDLGDFSKLGIVAENLIKVNINDLIKQVNNRLKATLVGSELEVAGFKVELQTSKTGFGGERLWFACPNCGCRVGTLFRPTEGGLGCRKCLGLKYKKQKYKGMVEQGGL
jgi:hypothetical protein